MNEARNSTCIYAAFALVFDSIEIHQHRNPSGIDENILI